MKEKTDRERPGPGVGQCSVDGVRSGGVEYEGGQIGMGGGEMHGECGSQALAIEKDSGGGKMAGLGEVLKCVSDIFLHTDLIGAGGIALAVTAVVEGEDVEP